MSDVKRWWLYERVGLDGKVYSGDVAPFENRRVHLEEDGQHYFKPVAGGTYEGPAKETLVMPVDDHDRIVSELKSKFEDAVDTYCTSVDKTVKRTDELISARETIATQKRVIDRLTAKIHKLAEMYHDHPGEVKANLIAEIEEIERGEK